MILILFPLFVCDCYVVLHDCVCFWRDSCTMLCDVGVLFVRCCVMLLGLLHDFVSPRCVFGTILCDVGVILVRF